MPRTDIPTPPAATTATGRPDTEIRLPDTDPHAASGRWDPTLRTLAAIVAAADLLVLGFFGLVPPLLVLGILGLAGAGLLARRPKPARILLLVVSIVGLAGGAPFAAPALPHPESFIDFVHALTSVPLRIVVGVVAIAALRNAQGSAIVVRNAALGGLAALVAVSAVATFAATGGVEPAVGDVVLEADTASFLTPDVSVAADERLVVDNTSLIRHTFTIDDVVDVSLPPASTTAVDLDLPPGTYDYYCALPGHEAMTGTLTVTG